MKYVIFIYLLFLVNSNSYSQEDSLVHGKVQAIVRKFSENSRRFTSFKEIPEFVINYIEQYNGREFKMSKWKRLSFVAILNNDYILSYDHNIEAHHFHSIIFETKGTAVTNVFNVITMDNVKQVNELLEIVESKRYWIRKEHL
jgi:hypothetical protein